MINTHTANAGISAPDLMPDPQLPQLLKELRVLDLSNAAYWGTMFLATLLFCIGEAFLAVLLDLQSFVIIFFFNTMFAVVVLFWYSIQLVSYIREPDSYRPPLGMDTTSVTTLPTFALAILLAFTNFILVGVTGWSESPLLPGLTALLLMILSLPRENSTAVYVLLPIALLFGLIALTTRTSPTPSIIAVNEHAAITNFGMFAYSGIMSYILRHFGTWRIDI